MTKIRKANKKDYPEIKEILTEVNEQTASMDFSNFWVAEKNNEIAGVVKLDGYDNYFFLSSLGVRIKEQKKGIAKRLIEHLLETSKKDIYIYTIIPEFFSKLGFKIIPAAPFLPEKSAMECERCIPEKCVTMVKSKHDT